MISLLPAEAGAWLQGKLNPIGFKIALEIMALWRQSSDVTAVRGEFTQLLRGCLWWWGLVLS